MARTFIKHFFVLILGATVVSFLSCGGGPSSQTMETKIAIFKGMRVRKIIYENEWWFSVIDVVEVLTDSINPRDDWYKMKIRVKSEDGFGVVT